MKKMGGRKKRGWKPGVLPSKGESSIQKLRAKLGYTFGDLHCRTLDDMTRVEIRALEKEYGAKVIRPAPA